MDVVERGLGHFYAAGGARMGPESRFIVIGLNSVLLQIVGTQGDLLELHYYGWIRAFIGSILT